MHYVSECPLKDSNRSVCVCSTSNNSSEFTYFINRKKKKLHKTFSSTMQKKNKTLFRTKFNESVMLKWSLKMMMLIMCI